MKCVWQTVFAELHKWCKRRTKCGYCSFVNEIDGHLWLQINVDDQYISLSQQTSRQRAFVWDIVKIYFFIFIFAKWQQPFRLVEMNSIAMPLVIVGISSLAKFTRNSVLSSRKLDACLIIRHHTYWDLQFLNYNLTINHNYGL